MKILNKCSEIKLIKYLFTEERVTIEKGASDKCVKKTM